LVLIEALKHKKPPGIGEVVGLLLGMYGALILVVPQFFE